MNAQMDDGWKGGGGERSDVREAQEEEEARGMERMLQFGGGESNSRVFLKSLEFWEHSREHKSSSVIHRPVTSISRKKSLEVKNPGSTPNAKPESTR